MVFLFPEVSSQTSPGRIALRGALPTPGTRPGFPGAAAVGGAEDLGLCGSDLTAGWSNWELGKLGIFFSENLGRNWGFVGKSWDKLFFFLKDLARNWINWRNS